MVSKLLRRTLRPARRHRSRVRLTAEPARRTTSGWLLRVRAHNEGVAGTFRAVVSVEDGARVPLLPLTLGWRGEGAPRQAVGLEFGGTDLLRLAVVRDGVQHPEFLLLAIDTERGVEQRHLLGAPDETRLTIEVRHLERGEVVVRQRVLLSCVLTDGVLTPSVSLIPDHRSRAASPEESASPELRVSTAGLRSALVGAELSEPSTSRERYVRWLKTQQLTPEHLLPHIDRRIEREWPSYMTQQRGHLDLSSAELRAKVAELGPWFLPFPVGGDLSTMDMETEIAREAANRVLFRRELINGTVAALLGDELAQTTFLDLGCNCGFFTLDIAGRGALHADGVDLREENIAQARFVAEHYGASNVEFQVLDVDALAGDRQWDVVLNLGVLYHVVNPLQFLRQTYELCRKFAVIDTVCHAAPISGFLLMGDKDVTNSAEGRETWELHPTYRGAIETIRYAGFSEVIELTGEADPPHAFYASGFRRCFLAFK